MLYDTYRQKFEKMKAFSYISLQCLPEKRFPRRGVGNLKKGWQKMQQTRELDMSSPIVIRALRIRTRMNLQIEGIPSSSPGESERPCAPLLTKQGHGEVVLPSTQNPSDRSHACASNESYLVHAWEKLSVRS